MKSVRFSPNQIIERIGFVEVSPGDFQRNIHVRLFSSAVYKEYRARADVVQALLILSTLVHGRELGKPLECGTIFILERCMPMDHMAFRVRV